MKQLIYSTIFLLVITLGAPSLFAGELSEVSWKYKGTAFSGLYAGGEEEKPAIVIFHQWMGISDHERIVASDLNRLGYTVLIADLYGKGNLPADREVAKKISGTCYTDRGKFRDRTTEAVKFLKKKSGKRLVKFSP